jgi:hypothetical protein
MSVVAGAATPKINKSKAGTVTDPALVPSPTAIDRETRPAIASIAKAITPERKADTGSRSMRALNASIV